MILTRKIQIFISEDDKDLRRSYYEKLYDMRNSARQAANLTVSHLFMLDNTLPYLSEEDRKNLQYIGAKGIPIGSKSGAVYAALSEKFKGSVDMGMISSVKMNAEKNYSGEKEWAETMTGKRSLRNYRSNIPIPFAPKRFANFHCADYTSNDGKTRNGVFFSITAIPFQMMFGRDRSGNRLIVDRILNGDYKMSTSSIVVDDKKNKIFLLLCVDIPVKNIELKKGKILYVWLGVMNPIVCTTSLLDQKKVWNIGTSEEFNYKRRQIQESLRRLQESAKYNKGGKGRVRKMQCIDRFNEYEKNYIETKLHVYSRELINIAISHECDTIKLLMQEEREKSMKEVSNKKDSECTEEEINLKFALRNWSYYGLKEKIKYKAKMHGIKVIQDKKDED